MGVNGKGSQFHTLYGIFRSFQPVCQFARVCQATLTSGAEGEEGDAVQCTE